MSSAHLRPALCFLLALLTILSFLPCAFAENSSFVSFIPSNTKVDSLTLNESSAISDENITVATGESTQLSSLSPLWASAEAAIMDLMNEYTVDTSGVALAYFNTVTGEEYYLNPDQYMDAASMYKVPLNMVFAERVANGELDPDSELGGYPYRTLLEETIIHSDNDLAAVMRYQLGDYMTYRRTIAPLMGVDPDNVDAKYYENNFFTPRQMLCCLKLLHNNPDQYPSVLETMQQAEPNAYFCRDEHRYTIAHKYGCNEDDYGILHLNDCAIIPTQDPIIIVLFTAGINCPEDFLTAFCTRCIDYTESVTAAREASEEENRKAQEKAAAQKQAELDAAAQASEEAAQEQAEALQQDTNIKAVHAHNIAVGLVIIVLFALGFVCVASLILFILRLREGHPGPTVLYFVLFLMSLTFLGGACIKLFL